MSNSSEDFQYDESVLNADETSKAYLKRLTLHDIDERIADKGFAVGWGNFMRSRRSWEFYCYLLQQKQEIHSTAISKRDAVVCSCGLIAPNPDDQSDLDAILRQSKGHIQTATREVVSVYVVKIDGSRAAGSRLHYWCENCGDIGATILNAFGDVSIIGLNAIRQSHKCPAR